jgi:hypothetical protein
MDLAEDIGVGLSRHEPRRVGRRFLEGVPLAHQRRVLLYACQKRDGLSLALPQGANLGIVQVEGLFEISGLLLECLIQRPLLLAHLEGVPQAAKPAALLRHKLCMYTYTYVTPRPRERPPQKCELHVVGGISVVSVNSIFDSQYLRQGRLARSSHPRQLLRVRERS